MILRQTLGGLTDNDSDKLRELSTGLLEARRVFSVLRWKHRLANAISLNVVLSYSLSQRVWIVIDFSARLET